MARLFLTLCIVIYSSALLVSAQDCPLPTKADIESVLPPLLVLSDGNQVYSPNVTEGSVQYVCLAQGSMNDTYVEISLIATFTPNPGEPEQTKIFDIECSSGTWSGGIGSLDPPPSSVVGVPPRTDCYRCRKGFGGDARCRACNNACNSGLMRCTGSGSTDCCLSFAANGQCSNTLSCSSSGTNFIANEDNNYFCSCIEGYTGSDCLTNIDDCDPNPCNNGASCMDEVANYSCICLDGFTGRNCSIDINECDPDPCQNGAACDDQVADYTCNCVEGYSGKNCSINIDDCSPNPCQNGAACDDQVADYTCNCVDGYSGKNCSINIDDCSPNPCQNGAACNDQVADYTCNCVEGYSGKNCSINIDDCSPGPCKNGAACDDQVADYICHCVEGYSGKNCSINIDDCSPSPCQNGATCNDEVADYQCECPNGFRGKNCSENINDCSPDPCVKGTCFDETNDYTCICKSGYYGKNCSLTITPSPSPTQCTLSGCENCDAVREGCCRTCSAGYTLNDNCLCAGERSQGDSSLPVWAIIVVAVIPFLLIIIAIIIVLIIVVAIKARKQGAAYKFPEPVKVSNPSFKTTL